LKVFKKREKFTLSWKTVSANPTNTGQENWKKPGNYRDVSFV